MKPKLFVCALAALHLSLLADDPPEFQRLQGSYNTAVQRAVGPLTQSYIQELTRLRDSFAAANRVADAQRVESEIKLMTDKIAAMDKATPVPTLLRPAVEARPLPSALGSGSQRNVVSDSKVKIPANSPDGYPLGALRKGDVLTLQYVEGLWKAHGHVASDNPDVVVEERGHQNESRLVIARASTNGKPSSVIALVPPLTVKTPFTFTVPEDRSDLILRIHANSDNKGNPGVVTYQLKITR